MQRLQALMVAVALALAFHSAAAQGKHCWLTLTVVHTTEYPRRRQVRVSTVVRISGGLQFCTPALPLVCHNSLCANAESCYVQWSISNSYTVASQSTSYVTLNLYASTKGPADIEAPYNITIYNPAYYGAFSWNFEVSLRRKQPQQSQVSLQDTCQTRCPCSKQPQQSQVSLHHTCQMSCAGSKQPQQSQVSLHDACQMSCAGSVGHEHGRRRDSWSD